MHTQLPTFLIVGAGKTGTTWVHQCLTEHPDVCVPKEKEIRYFSYNYDKGHDWYRSFFDECSTCKAVGEISPSYMIHPAAAKRIYKYNAGMKLIFIFRDPIARAYSHYCMLLRSGKADEDVNSALRKGTRLVSEGLYFSHLERFLRLFDREKIKLLIYDDLIADPERFVSNIFVHLGVDALFKPTIIDQKYHATKSRPRFQKTYNKLVQIGKAMERKSGIYNTIVHSVRRSGLVDVFHWANKGDDFPEMSWAKKRELAEMYKKDVDALSKRVNRDLSCLWLDRYLT